jgi:alanyl-tRNA synthetase
MDTRRLYYDDSFARDFVARVLSCEPAIHDGNPAWEVVLDQSALYPASGGQPHDLGKLGDANVLDVRDEESEIVHVIDRQVELGPLKGCVDWTRRFDHMQQHSGQHLLSAIFQERFGLATVSFHMGTEISTIDLRGQEPSEAILEGAERATNQAVFDDRPINVRYGTAEQLAEIGVRKAVDRQGILRAIEIEGADLQPCGGTHVRRTAQIGMTLVRRCTRIRQDFRVEFVCGGRAERVARNDFLVLKRTADKLGCAFDEVPVAAARTIDERDTHFKSVRGMLQRLAEADATLALQSISPGVEGTRIVARTFQEESQPEYLGAFASQLAKSDNTIALLARVPCGHLIFAQHPSTGKDMSGLLKQVFQTYPGKGGGTRDFARGKLIAPAQGPDALALARKSLESQD